MARRSVANFQLATIERETLHERIYRELRRSLMAGVVRPGQPLSYRSLADALGVSPMPVRDAVRRLIAERALEALPNRTIAVPNLDAERIGEIYKMRISLEGLAAEEAAAKINAKTLGELRLLQDQMEQTLKAGDIGRYLDLNWRFHFKIYGAAGMSQLTEVIEGFWLQIGPLISQQKPQHHEDDIFTHHKAAIDALERGDGPAARAAIAADLQDAGQALLETLSEIQAPPAPARPRGRKPKVAV